MQSCALAAAGAGEAAGHDMEVEGPAGGGVAGVGELGWYSADELEAAGAGVLDPEGAKFFLVLRSRAAGGLAGPLVLGLEGHSSAVGRTLGARW